MARSLILCGLIQIPIPYKYLGFGYKGLVFCRNNGWLMKNMDKGLTVPKWVLINRPKMPQNLSVQIVCPIPKVWDFDEKRLHWASVVRRMAYWGKIWQIAIFLFLKAYDDRGSANEAMVQFRQNKDSRILIFLLLLEKQLPPSYWYIKISPVLNIDCYVLR